MSIPTMATEVDLARSVPNTAGTTPSLTSNPNPTHTPQATGAITVPHAPSGAIVTNTGRSSSATKAMVSNLHPLKGWNGVRTPGNAG